jgi:hypothetical protein
MASPDKALALPTARRARKSVSCRAGPRAAFERVLGAPPARASRFRACDRAAGLADFDVAANWSRFNVSGLALGCAAGLGVGAGFGGAGSGGRGLATGCGLGFGTGGGAGVRSGAGWGAGGSSSSVGCGSGAAAVCTVSAFSAGRMSAVGARATIVIGTASESLIGFDHIGHVMKAATNTAKCRAAEDRSEGRRLFRIRPKASRPPRMTPPAVD